MLMREPIITNKKKDLKKAELFVKSRLLQILFIIIHYPTDRHSLPSSTPRIPHPVRTFTPTTTQNSGVARRGRAREGETAFANSECFPFSQTCPRQSVPQKGNPIAPPTKCVPEREKRCRLIRMPQILILPGGTPPARSPARQHQSTLCHRKSNLL